MNLKNLTKRKPALVATRMHVFNGFRVPSKNIFTGIQIFNDIQRLNYIFLPQWEIFNNLVVPTLSNSKLISYNLESLMDVYSLFKTSNQIRTVLSVIFCMLFAIVVANSILCHCGLKSHKIVLKKNSLITLHIKNVFLYWQQPVTD